MASVPSIKGSVFASVVEDVRKLRARGELSRADAARWLEPGDMALLHEEIVVARWYDIRSYVRMNEILLELEGSGSNEFLRERGRQTARRLLEGGLYAQLEYLHRTEVAKQRGQRARFEAFGRDLRLLTTLSASILNFSHWASKPDSENEDRYVIEVSDASDFPEVLCWRSDGFVNEMASQHGQPDLWGWDRPASDRIVFRMLRPV
jgi:hypothetical protein